jgi:PhnB protein
MNTSQLSPYLNFNSNCREAMEFYQNVLGGELEIHTFGEYDSPEMPVADDQKDKVMHAVLKNDTLSFMASDGIPGRAVVFGDSISMSLSGADEAQLTTFFTDLSAGGAVTVPLAKQVWGDSFGMFTDKFGIHWLVNISAKTADQN